MKKELWLALRGYRFDDLVPAHLTDRVAAMFGGSDASTHAFAAKIAKKHGWAVRFALRAIAEYKKYVYLGIVSDFPVTPPRVIDTVWHEHLLFTRAYRAFCDTVLGRDFDHNPELVPDGEQTDQFRAQYAATLALYVDEFHRAPPEDIWGTPKFGGAAVPPAKTPARRDAMDAGSSSADTEMPLYMYFGGAEAADGGGGDGFGGGGGFMGGGGGSSWADDAVPSSDGGESCSSGCSSGCGGE